MKALKLVGIILVVIALGFLLSCIGSPYEGWWKISGPISKDLPTLVYGRYGTVGSCVQTTTETKCGPYKNDPSQAEYPNIHPDGTPRPALRTIGIVALILMISSAFLLVGSLVSGILAYAEYKHGHLHHAGGAAIFAGFIIFAAAGLMTGWYVGVWNDLDHVSGKMPTPDYAEIFIWLSGVLSLISGLMLGAAHMHHHYRYDVLVNP